MEEAGSAALSEVGPGTVILQCGRSQPGCHHQTFLANGICRGWPFVAGRGGRGGGRGTTPGSAAAKTPERGPFRFLPTQLFLPGDLSASSRVATSPLLHGTQHFRPHRLEPCVEGKRYLGQRVVTFRSLGQLLLAQTERRRGG